MDYQKEFKRLQEGSSYWKPKSGQFRVKALSEIEETTPYEKKDQDGKIIESNPQRKITIEVDGEKRVWTFGEGQTIASTNGQLVELAIKKHNGTLLGKEFTVAIKNDGRKNDYTIVL